MGSLTIPKGVGALCKALHRGPAAWAAVLPIAVAGVRWTQGPGRVGVASLNALEGPGHSSLEFSTVTPRRSITLYSTWGPGLAATADVLCFCLRPTTTHQMSQFLSALLGRPFSSWPQPGAWSLARTPGMLDCWARLPTLPTFDPATPAFGFPGRQEGGPLRPSPALQPHVSPGCLWRRLTRIAGAFAAVEGWLRQAGLRAHCACPAAVAPTCWPSPCHAFAACGLLALPLPRDLEAADAAHGQSG